MIAFNGRQYLPAASHGNMRITAACLGGQWVIDNRYMTPATQQAIIAAFGAEEGIAVIHRTNDYLNALALTDPQRAQQLAMFINEDPLLVCSLVETSKTRWLEAPNKDAWIDTGWIPRGEDFEIETIIKLRDTSGWSQVYATRWTDNGIDHMYNGVNTYFHTAGKSNTSGFTAYQVDTPYRIVHNYTTISRGILGGTMQQVNTSATADFTTSLTLKLFHGDNYNNFNGYMQMFIRRQGGIDVQHLCPFIRNGENGMLDIISGTFHPNANTEGSFTIALTDKQ